MSLKEIIKNIFSAEIIEKIIYGKKRKSETETQVKARLKKRLMKELVNQGYVKFGKKGNYYFIKFEL